ncbi:MULTISPECIES: MetQ/NlpA family ABC transporter substrate-binding protein [Kocuria]|uniref:ABC transporter substrate-binding protein n=1 Tax=Kocuria rosea subsp. polaris TaxID=136273 RepID=A0A0W8IMG3_KOCRO|nr:MetQ/NlpA family ABC transporter substrate-binding protein [Kocuria polaris]KUG61141.1 ABC transporter substrate-binding protein [Kocuria polaris]
MRSQRLPFLALATTLGLTLTACGGSAGESSGEGVLADDKVTIGVVGTDPTHDALKQLAEEQGITVEYVDFSDYNQPNPANESGDVEMTWFQHIPFLADYNNSAGGSITPVGSTSIYPLGLYSNQYDSVEQFQEGDEIAVPNDAVNLSRALLVLEAAGLVELTSDTLIPTELDVDTEASTVTVTPVSAEQTVLSLDSVAGSVINNDFLSRADIDPKSALAQDDPDAEGSRAYVNLFTTTEELADDETLRQVADLYHEQPVLDAEMTETKDTAVPLQLEQQELQELTERYQQELKDQEQ